MSLSRLIYNSVSSNELVSNEDLRSLVGQCSENNETWDITGLLLLSGNHFLQVLEGPSKLLSKLLGNIMSDSRHRDVHLLTFEPICDRFFDRWSMHLVDLYDLPLDTRRFMAKKYQHEDEDIVIPDQLHLAYSLLLDARAFCDSEPWSIVEANATAS